ncbi:hypothetical protein EF405_14140 [Cyclobacteriaceae bacterium YHN15]|jgi:hypothetical protein|nr:hypothetical protein EF405_14140 [Cyclobacteriaceae bacterium YHN15]
MFENQSAQIFSKFNQYQTRKPKLKDILPLFTCGCFIKKVFPFSAQYNSVFISIDLGLNSFFSSASNCGQFNNYLSPSSVFIGVNLRLIHPFFIHYQ